MTALPQGGDIILISNEGGPTSGCSICSGHRRVSGQSTCNGTVCFARVTGGNGSEICGACLQIIKALAP
jgi:hypothetical protein